MRWIGMIDTWLREVVHALIDEQEGIAGALGVRV